MALTPSAALITEQKALHYTPYVQALLTKTALTTYTPTTVDYILKVEHIIEPFKEEVKVVLDNSAQYWNDKDLRGYTCVIGWGFWISGAGDYVDSNPLKVINMEFNSEPGVLTCTLHLIGIASELANDRACKEYTAGTEATDGETEGDADTNKTLVAGILEATLLPYGDGYYTAYTLDWTGCPDADINTFDPKDAVRIYFNTTRMSAVRRIIDRTNAFIKVDNDGKIYFIKPTIAGTTYAYTYEMASGEHYFFYKAKGNAVMLPNRVTIYGGDWDDDTQDYEFNGTAEHSSATNYKQVTWFEHLPGASSDAICLTVATSIIANMALNMKTCEARVPMNCYAEIYDYVKITDVRENDTAIGNIGRIRRVYQQGKYIMELSYGGYADDRRISEFVGDRQRTPNTQHMATSMTFSLPFTYLYYQEMFVQVFVVPDTYALYLCGYSFYAAGGDDDPGVCDLVVWTDTETYLDVQLDSTLGDVGSTKKYDYPILLFRNGSGADIIVYVSAQSLSYENFVSASVAVDIR